MLVFLIVLLPFIGGIMAALLPENVRRYEAWLAGAVALACVGMGLALYGDVASGQVLRYEIPWVEGLGLVFRMDGFAWLFALLVSLIGALVALYARYYMSDEDPVPRFFAFLLAFMGSMLGVVLSGNLIQLVMFWELTSLTSFMLIGYWYHRSDARRGARMSLTITVAGGLCLLAGVMILGTIVGSYDLDVVLAAGARVRAHPDYLLVLVLIAVGALSKSAQFPFHFWLPRAMAAPTPVSAFLHSATMVKAGVFLLIRLWPVLAGTESWSWLIGGAGLITLLLGAFLAIFQNDLKGLLAYSTISHLGLITLLLGIGSPLAAVAAIFHTLNHATFKASLFMAAGIIDHETGTRDLRKLGGLVAVMPITTTLAMVAAAAMAGVPLLNGFLSKEMFFAETLSVDTLKGWGLPLLATLAGLFSVTYSLRFIHEIFFGPLATDLEREPHEPPYWMRFPIEILVLVCLVVGVVPGLTVGSFLDLAVRSVLGGETPAYSLMVWHGFTLPLLMSTVALVGGLVLFAVLEVVMPLQRSPRVPLLHGLDGQRVFERVLMRTTNLAGWLLILFTSPRLQRQILAMVLVTLVVGAAPTLAYWDGSFVLAGAPDPLFVLLWVVGGVCAVLAAWQAKYHRLASVMLLSGSGLVTCLTFAWFSAPDLALTQFAVETVTTVLILLGLRWLPPRLESRRPRPSPRERARRGRDLLIAVLAGAALAVLAYWAMTRPPVPAGVADFFLKNALPEGGGSNVVNVILVDFRALDTLGEISVLGIVALTVYALLRRFRPAPESLDVPQQRDDSVDRLSTEEQALRGRMRVPLVFVGNLMTLLVVLAIYLFMRGHNQPGGGFVAGLVMSVAIILQYMVAGVHWVERHLPIRPHTWIATGVLLAIATGMGAWLFGYPFLTSHSPHPVLPVLGEIALPSAFLFDLGVFMLVVGATVLILISLAHQSVRSHRRTALAEEHKGELL